MSLSFTMTDVCKRYEGTTVLNGCSFSFGQDRVYVLMGANGSGKSTLLRICSLLEKPDSGEVIYHSNGSAVRDSLELIRRITLVLPRVGVFNTTVAKNVGYGLRVRGIRGDRAEERVGRALQFVGLTHKKRQNALTLSSGEAQRLGIARALAIEPEVLFLDEPTASVDEENREIIEDLVLKLKEQGNAVIVLTTHDGSQAERLADRVLLLRNGKIEPYS